MSKLPDSLEEIYFGYSFNQPIDNIKFPKNLKVIVFSNKFNQSINNVKFPDHLVSIHFGDEFNKQIDNAKFPDNLQIITFGNSFCQLITNLPILLKELRLNTIYQMEQIKKIKLPFGCVIYDDICDIVIHE